MAIVEAHTSLERIYLAGQWVETGESFEVRSPYSGDTVATVARAEIGRAHV